MFTNKSKSIYDNKFNEISALGMGGFSTVFKSEHKLDKNVYAIKKVCFKAENEENVTKELRLLSQLNNDFVVKYIDSWIEPNYYINTYNNYEEQHLSSGNLLYSPDLSMILHIQMELCAITLREAIKIILQKCVTTDKTLSLIGYYISSELLYEILECVHYLHSQNPAIIHRDLKPENILLTNFVNNRFVKLSDFGLSTFHRFADQSHTKYTGTKSYRAFELNISSKYTTKADVYSLGIILQELFHIDINDTNRNYLGELKPKMDYLVNLIKRQLSYFPDDRPNCERILSEKHNWILSDELLLNDQSFQKTLTKSEVLNLKIDENFIEFFIQNKYKSRVNKAVSHKSASNRSIHPIRPIRSITEPNPSSMSDAFKEKLMRKTNTESKRSQPEISYENDYEYYSAKLQKSEEGYGLKVIGGVEEGRNLEIGSITLGGVAQRNGVLKVGDEIISINERNITGVRHHEVLQLIAQSGSTVTFSVRRKRYSTVI